MRQTKEQAEADNLQAALEAMQAQMAGPQAEAELRRKQETKFRDDMMFRRFIDPEGKLK